VLIQPLQQFCSLSIGGSQLLRACKGQQVIPEAVLGSVRLDQPLLNAFGEI
jgi:hypothetical protein